MEKVLLRACHWLLVPALILLATERAGAQPCFTVDQCAQIRMTAQRMAAEQQARQAAAAAAQARAEQEAAKEAARERVRQAAEERKARVEEMRVQAQARADQERAQAEQERAQTLWRAEQARLQAEADQRAQEAAISRARLQAQQQAAYEDQKRREQEAVDEQRRRDRLEAENRAAAQLAAENSPDNHCRDQKVAGDLLDFFNGLQAAADFGNRAVDIDHLTTIHFDRERRAVSCHGSFVLQNGRSISGTMTTRLNVAGRVLTEFHQD